MSRQTFLTFAITLGKKRVGLSLFILTWVIVGKFLIFPSAIGFAQRTSAPEVKKAAATTSFSQTYWKLTFSDEFQGKRNRLDDHYCFDVLKPQCHVWFGNTHNCDLTDVSGPGFYPPTKENMAAAINTVDQTLDWTTLPYASVQTRYGQLLETNLKYLDKCTWTLYEMVNWMATDYKGHFSSRFDASQVKVDPSGKGYLTLSATFAPSSYKCVYGGTVAGANCSIQGFQNPEVIPGIQYWVDTNSQYPGVYYHPIDGGCPYGGSQGVNCQIRGFGAGVLHPGTPYWVDTNPQYPGVYYHSIGGGCPYGGALGGGNCQITAFSVPNTYIVAGINYWVETNPQKSPGVYYHLTGSGNGCPYGGVPGVFCQLISFAPDRVDPGVHYWVDTDPRWPGVYYGGNSQYRCRENIEYSPSIFFRNLTCPMLNGGLMSMNFDNRPFINPINQESTKRGFTQKYGRFEVKARIPKGRGVFPATWLMPTEGGWPYVGGEIDIMEARDNADEVYQSYHHGHCFNPNSPYNKINAASPADCLTKGGLSFGLSRGFTTTQRKSDEFWQRDHVFAVEWTPYKLSYFINNQLIASLRPGMVGSLDPTPPSDMPYNPLQTFTNLNFPTTPFYWILNLSLFNLQNARTRSEPLYIDYVRTYQECLTTTDFCPCGGQFVEGTGCVLSQQQTLNCPTGHPPVTVQNNVYASECQPVRHDCPNGGTVAGPNCLVLSLQNPKVFPAVRYWVDSNPQYPGVYYHPVNGGCPFGGSQGINCMLTSFPPGVLESGVSYWIDANPQYPGVYYSPDFR